MDTDQKDGASYVRNKERGIEIYLWSFMNGKGKENCRVNLSVEANFADVKTSFTAKDYIALKPILTNRAFKEDQKGEFKQYFTTLTHEYKDSKGVLRTDNKAVWILERPKNLFIITLNSCDKVKYDERIGFMNEIVRSLKFY